MKHLRRTIPYVLRYRTQLYAGLALVLASSAIASVIPWLLRSAIDGIRSGATVARTAALAGAVVGVALIAGAMRYGMRQLMNTASRHLEFDLRNDLFRHLETLDATFFSRMRTGDTMARLTNDLGAVRMAAGPAIMYLSSTVTSGIFALVFMLRINPMLTGVALAPMIILPILTIRLGKAVHDRFESVQEHFSTLTTHAQENLTGARVVRAYRQEAAELDRFTTLNNEYLSRNMSLARLWGMFDPLFGLLAGLAAVVVLGVGGTLVVRGSLTVGSLVAFNLYLAMLTWPMIALGWVVNLFQRGEASMGRLVEILDARPLVTDSSSPDELPRAQAGRSIEFRNVGFHYPTPEGSEPRWVLRHIRFKVDAGETLGVVGATGSGKSALIDLIARVHDPQEGEILLDGVPLQNIPLAELRREIGYAPQESLLFSDTIAANLSYGTEDESGWTWAAKIAQLEETVTEFPGGYQTILGERGINLSGGQKQRAALARALARKPHVVLLDDALSAVDTHTEADILHALRTALAGRTAVIASHRITAVRDATSIIVLDDGKLVESGRNDELLARRGRYWSLLRRQQLVEAIETTHVA
jgi:ATP-binding cassette, subfamily B, multidrug efflux pump